MWLLVGVPLHQPGTANPGYCVQGVPGARASRWKGPSRDLPPKNSTDGKAGARMSRKVSRELQSLRACYPCLGIAIRATRHPWSTRIREKTFAAWLLAAA